MRQLVYISSAVSDFDEKSFSGILASARRNNAEDDVTGVLMYQQNQFFQVLEGPDTKVHDCFARISADSRHRGIIKLFDEPVENRCFSKWSMAVLGLHNCQIGLRKQMIDLLELKQHQEYEELHANKIVGVFAETYLADLRRFAREVRL